MAFEDLSREQLLELLDDFVEQHEERRREQSERADEQDKSIAELRIYQVELELQNRELRSAQGELEEARDRYSELFELAPIAYLALNDAGVITTANQGAASLFHSAVTKLCGQSLVTLCGASEQLASLLARSAQQVTRAAGRVPFVVGGSQLEVEVNISCSRDAFGLSTYRCTLLDVTARARAERERDRALASERALHECFQTLDLIHVAVNEKLSVASASAVSELVQIFAEPILKLFSASSVRIEVAGYAPSVLHDQVPCDEATSHLHAPVLSAGRKLGEIRVTVPHSVPRRHGQALADYARTLEILADRLAVALEAQRMHEAEASDKRRSRWLEEARRALSGATEVDEVTRAIRDCCERARSQLGIASAAYVWENEVLVPLVTPPRFASRMQAVLATADLHERQTSAVHGRLARILRKLGHDSLVVLPLSAREQTMGLLCFALPQRERQGLERAVDELAFMAASALDTARLLNELRGAVDARDTLLALVAHDLRSPLNAISLTTSSLSEPPPHAERRSSAPQFALIQRSIQRMAHLVEDLLTAANIDSGSFAVDRRPVTASELAFEACALNMPAADAKKISLVVDCSEPALRVAADRERVLQVLTNLIVNALKFSTAGARVELECKLHGGDVRYCVRDEGPGMSAEQATQVFRRYWRTKDSRGGLGLGLFIAERIVNAHQGRIWVDSKLGGGCAFYFTLPLTPDSQDTPAPSKLGNRARSKPGTNVRST